MWYLNTKYDFPVGEEASASNKSTNGVTKPKVWPTLAGKTSQYANPPPRLDDKDGFIPGLVSGPVPAEGVDPLRKSHL